MKKLSKLKLHSAVRLEDKEMKAIFGSYGSHGGQRFCHVGGECVWVPCSSDSDCPNYWGEKAECW